MAQVLCHLPKVENPNLLVGFEHSDDAAVYRINETTALVQSVDFFPPMVSNPYVYGAAAAANALSDIYAMGAVPVLAMNILCMPENLSDSTLSLILEGGYDKMKEAGVVIAGGHSLRDDGPKFGFCVTGIVHPEKVLTNSAAKAGQSLILTKPLGTGILNRAMREEPLSKKAEQDLFRSMTELNRTAAQVISGYSVSACTDITGFGLLGHAYEMAKGSRVSLTIDTGQIDFLPQTMNMAEKGFLPGKCTANRRWIGKNLSASTELDSLIVEALFSPETSGGLLFSLPPEEASDCIAELHSLGVAGKLIGFCLAPEETPLRLI